LRRPFLFWSGQHRVSRFGEKSANLTFAGQTVRRIAIVDAPGVEPRITRFPPGLFLRHGAEWMRARPVNLSEPELDKAGLVLAARELELNDQF
jgi:hypothetical protein